jgi:hypothetical protein
MSMVSVVRTDDKRVEASAQFCYVILKEGSQVINNIIRGDERKKGDIFALHMAGRRRHLMPMSICFTAP